MIVVQWKRVEVSARRLRFFDGYGAPSAIWGVDPRPNCPCLKGHLDARVGIHEMAGVSVSSEHAMSLISALQTRFSQVADRHFEVIENEQSSYWMTICHWKGANVSDAVSGEERALDFVGVFASVPFNVARETKHVFDYLLIGEEGVGFSSCGAQLLTSSSSTGAFLGLAKEWEGWGGKGKVSLASKAAVLAAGSRHSLKVINSGRATEWGAVLKELGLRGSASPKANTTVEPVRCSAKEAL